MGMVKKASAELVTANIAQQEWINSTSGKMSGGRIKTASDNISKTLSYYDPARWLLSHVTIMASVDVELADPKDPTSDYFIKPEHSIFVNNNGDCWERELLAKTYKTFLGANNYCEHVQVPEMSRGKVIDAAIREVDLGVLGSDGKPATTLYVDLLIATSWDFADMCQKIISKEYNSLSMGCFIAYSRCSRCGKIAHDETEQCDHVKYYRHNTFYDDFGNKRIVGEICGSKNDPESVKFIDASWVRKPAFPGAVVRNIVSPPESIKINLSKAVTSKGTDSLMEAVRKNEVISTEHHSVEQFLKVASEKIAEDPQTESLDVRFGDEPPKEDTDTSNKTDDSAFPDMGGAGDPSTTTQDPTGADPLPPTDPSSEQQPETSPEEANLTPFEDIKKSIEDSVITGVKQILLDKVQKAIAERNVNNDIGEGINNYTSSTRDSEALVKEASSPVNIKYLKDRYSIDISKVPNIITASTLLAMACIKTPSDLSKYGFTRKEAAEAIRYVYARMKGKNVSDEVVDFVCNTKETKGKEANLKFITKHARLMTSEEKEVIQKWSELLKSYNL